MNEQLYIDIGRIHLAHEYVLDRVHRIVNGKRALVAGSALVTDVKKKLRHIVYTRGAGDSARHLFRRIVRVAERRIAYLHSLGQESAKEVGTEVAVAKRQGESLPGIFIGG